MKQYTTIKGDTWSRVAYKELGSEYLFPLLLDENQKFRDFLIFPPGITLNIPDIVDVETVDNPPWMNDIVEEDEEEPSGVDNDVGA
ncbi:hypothetical protein BTO30_14860 [Domibacillus antri]|uniref:Phage tail protein n=1 Tax=Domibacillus antri TaxID=1714264 RepID=A0A1Q8Q267_9BACI|nr:hypothetical protein [Domibacillus antri]OLN21398.1 hypothetical protein BTO30_14860 [Domibacillus antri]